MKVDLLKLVDVAPPMGDLSFNSALSEPRAIWVSPLPEETSEPERRIAHSRVVRLPGAARLHRLGLRGAPGFHNCGSHVNEDWVSAFRLFGRINGEWRRLLTRSNLPQPAPDEIVWFDLAPDIVDGVIIELRASGLDAGWVPWNVAAHACVLEGESLASVCPAREHTLAVGPVDLDTLPAGVSATLVNGAVRFTTATYSVGFYLSRPGMSHLSLTTEDPALGELNTLFSAAGSFKQGPKLHLVGGLPTITGPVRFNATGTTTVQGNRITYDFTAGQQHYVLTWTATAEGLTLRARRESAADQEAWFSSAWTLSTRNSVTPAQAIGRITQQGQTGLMTLPIAVHLPRLGTLQIASDSPAVTARFDAYRPQDFNALELKLGEQALPNGNHLLTAGRHEAEIAFRLATPAVGLRDDAPAVAARALRRTYFTALTYRPEMATLSNNGASIPCAISMDTWASFYFELGEPLPDFPAHELLRASLERWLDGGQSYADGHIVQNGSVHDAQDEYLMTGAAVLRGLADYLEQAASESWFQSRLDRIRARLAAMRARDLDGDGLIESKWRTGVSGTKQWSTCWFDVISFGWKDAFTNAILYPALGKLAGVFARHHLAAEAADLNAWAAQLKGNYLPTFFNPATGWLAGWRCKADKLHDHAFLMVNGCAITAGLVPDAQAKDICARLLAEMKAVGLPPAVYGLPGNLWRIPNEDLADIMQGYAFGYYQNGGRSHAQARHFVMALYRCGFTAEADRLLLEMCAGYADALVFGGAKSGVDWRYWDDRPCGYEGLLTDQFGMLEVLFHRYGRRS
ncbi:MAG: hypothetical protein IT582_00890 [Opitutaceae bacterium]|nr:hypothetical protein [Opitutaceae bacterium]